VSIFGAAAIGLFVPSRLSRHIGKRNAALLTGGLSIFVAPMPLIGRLLGWMPENGSSELLPILMLFSVVDVSFFIMTGVLVSSMVADVVEESELRTGRRSEGTFFAARSFAQKAVSGVGVLGSTLILSLVGFPEGARTAQEVSPEVLRDLALVYIPSFAILYAAFLALLASYRISRDAHAANLETLSGRAS
jgi:GPH family glycoside/pentoside/hexuronide:cation symporter